MPSFDVVSEVDLQEVHNAVDQANREISTRYDFRGITASFERLGSDIKLTAQADIQLDQMMDILREKLIKRAVDPMVMEPGAIMPSGKLLHQTVAMKQGIETLLAKKIVKLIKDKKLKVQAAIQGDQVRVTGKKRDDLQAVMAEIKAAGFEVPFQYQNFRDCRGAANLVGILLGLPKTRCGVAGLSRVFGGLTVFVGVFDPYGMASR